MYYIIIKHPIAVRQKNQFRNILLFEVTQNQFLLGTDSETFYFLILKSNISIREFPASVT